jgi:hypothetical protein
MYMLNARCIYCDFEGVLEVLGEPHDVPESKIFRRLSHNPLTGHIHYQCPACDVILLIDPMDILADDFMMYIRHEPRTTAFLSSFLADFPMH